MAAKNKINSLNLIGFAKRFPKGHAPQKNVTSCNQLRKPSRTDEPDYSTFLSKDSAIYLIREAKSLNRKSCNERRLENEQAEIQLRKCNKILKEHYLQRREQGQKALNGSFEQIEQIPTLSKKLMSIMALNVTTSPKKTISLDDLKHCRGFECQHHTIDYKPQSGGRLNRWRMKIPHRKSQSLINLESAEPNTSSSSKRNRKVQPPETPVLATGLLPSKEGIKPDKMLTNNQTTNKYKNMWLIGSRYIPRLN